MITYSNIQRHDHLPFDQYLQLNGYSHSFLKSNIGGVSKHFEQTDKVRVGHLVDAILTEPAKADMSSPLYPQCKKIAAKVMEMFGDAINLCSKQANFTANMNMGDFSMPVKGRLDLLLEGFAVIDLKVTSEKDIDALIQFMGYENQLWHYAKMAKVIKAYLLFYSIPRKEVIVRAVDVSSDHNEFWLNKIIDFGQVPGIDAESVRINAGLQQTDQLHY